MNTDQFPEAISLPIPAPTESRQDRKVRLAVGLLQLGVSDRQVEELLYAYDLDIIEQQLIWFPARSARKKASLIVSAIRQNYEKPANYVE